MAPRFTLLATLLLLGATPLGARAQDTEAEADPPAEEASVEAAEAALVDLEYERALEVADAALNQGGHSRQQTRRLHELIGLAASFLENEDRAYEAYVRMLALDPDAEMDQSLPPDLRAPFLRARGWWAAQGQRFGSQLRVGDPGGDEPLRVVFELNDPLRIARQFDVRVRGAGASEWQESERELDGSERHVIASLPLDLANENPEEIEMTLTVLDQNGNVLLIEGTQLEPVRAPNPRYRAPRPGGGSVDQGSSVAEEWWFWTLIGAVLVGAGVGVGLYFGLPPQLNGQTEVVFGL